MYFCSDFLLGCDGRLRHCCAQKKGGISLRICHLCVRLCAVYVFLEAVGETYGDDALVEVAYQLVFAFESDGEFGVDVVLEAATEVAADACFAVCAVDVNHVVTYGETYQGIDVEVFGDVYQIVDVGVEVKHRHFVVLEEVVEGCFAAEAVGEEVLSLDAEADGLSHLCVVKKVYTDGVRAFLRISAYAEDGAEGCQ